MEKPVHIFISRNRVTMRCALSWLCFHGLKPVGCVLICKYISKQVHTTIWKQSYDFLGLPQAMHQQLEGFQLKITFLLFSSADKSLQYKMHLLLMWNISPVYQLHLKFHMNFEIGNLKYDIWNSYEMSKLYNFASPSYNKEHLL